MSKVKSAPKKKRLSYERDHYNRGGENTKTWRKAKPIKKARARRSFRQAANQVVKSGEAGDPDASTAPKKERAIRQMRVEDWGSMHLREFVDSRRIRNANKGE